ncbi:MAG: ATP-binding protein, partial [Chloroflexota bacterium]
MTSHNAQVIRMSFPSELGHEKVAAVVTGLTAEAIGFSPEKRDDIKTSVAEACTNAIEHGNACDSTTDVEVVVTVKNDHLSIKVIDSG